MDRRETDGLTRTVRLQSILAYNTIRDITALTQAEYIADWLRLHGPANRRTISKQTGISINAVCGRVKELLDQGLLLALPNLVEDEETHTLTEYVMAWEDAFLVREEGSPAFPMRIK